MSAIITWLTSHQAVLFGFGVALLDFLFALVPSWKSNGILHWIYLTLGGKETS
jgi:hypothetical protein